MQKLSSPRSFAGQHAVWTLLLAVAATLLLLAAAAAQAQTRGDSDGASRALVHTGGSSVTTDRYRGTQDRSSSVTIRAPGATPSWPPPCAA